MQQHKHQQRRPTNFMVVITAFALMKSPSPDNSWEQGKKSCSCCIKHYKQSIVALTL